jgi:myo-inositol-1(or 4)-monophosphatase
MGPPDDELLDELARLATAVAADAAALLVDGLLRVRADVSTKTTSTDMVTEMDRASERLIVDAVVAARPQDSILGEEGTDRAGRSGVRWVIDPIDGTTNYLYAHPGFSVSIAVEIGDETMVGVVHDPLHREVFTAVRGGGARRNDRPIRHSDKAELATALVATGFAYDPGRRARQAAVLAHLLPVVRDIRRMGAASVDLCSVACGRVDAYYERGLGHWDLAAGALIAAEAGATVGSLPGPPPAGPCIVTAPPRLYDQLAAALVAAGADEA